jgi:hypothetical protein
MSWIGFQGREVWAQYIENDFECLVSIRGCVAAMDVLLVTSLCNHVTTLDVNVSMILRNAAATPRVGLIRTCITLLIPCPIESPWT